MKSYADWAPAAHDVRALNAETMGFDGGDRSEWLVALVHHRESDLVTESNWHVGCGMIEAAGVDPEDYEQHSFNHWAVGWVEIMLVRPGTVAHARALTIEARLADYPLLDDDDHSQREQDAANELWAVYGQGARLEYIRDHRSQFEFRSFADMLGCARGRYFAGYASELVS